MLKQAHSTQPKPSPETTRGGDGIPDALKNFDFLPDSAYVRQPVVKGLCGCSDATIWRRVNSGLLPKPQKLGSTTVWNVGELRTILNGGKAL